MADQNVPMGALNSTMGDPLILNGLIEMLRNGQGKNITMMVHEAISKVIPTPITPFSTSSIMPAGISRVSPPRMHLVGMQDPIMPSDTPNVMQKDVSRRCVMPSTSRPETPITRVASSPIPHSIPSTSNMDAPSIPVEMDMHAHIRSTSQINNPSSLGSVRILPPTPEQVSLRSLIESQSRILRLLQETLENVEIRKEILKQIELCEKTLLGSAGLTSDEQVHQFQKEASEEDLKYALLHGSQGLRQHMLDRGEKLVTSHESEEAQQSNSSSSEHEEELEEHDELFFAYNDLIVIPERGQETILEFQKVGDKNNEEGVQFDEQSTPTIRIVPRRKRTQRKRMDRNK